MGASGVFPVYNNVFKINVAGRTSVAGDFVTIKDLETFGLSIEGKTTEWTPMDLAGWARQAITGKKLTIAFKGKRNYGDPGNDFIAGKLLCIGQSCESRLQWTLPNGGALTVDCVINLTTPAGGDSDGIDSLEFDVLSDGLPIYVGPGNLSTLTFASIAGTVAGTTKVASIAPALSGGNSYVYKVGATLSGISAGNVLNQASGWLPFVVATNYPASAGQQLVVCEVDAGLTAVKGGTSTAVVM